MYLGIDVGGTNLKAGVISEAGNLIFRHSEPMSPNDAAEKILNHIKNVIEFCIAAYPEIKCVGIGVPGMINDDGVLVVSPNIKNFINVPIREYFKTNINIPSFIENDANTAAVAEMMEGAGKSFSDFVYVTLGTGVGGAIIAKGELFRGTNGSAGELGHIIIDFNEDYSKDKPDYRIGILEEHINRAGLINYIKNKISKYPESAMNRYDSYDVKDIADCANDGDELAIDCLTIAGKKLGVTLAGVANLLDISNFVIGGGISLCEILLDEAEETLRRRALPTMHERINVLPATFYYDTGIIGAALYGKKLFSNTK